MADSSSPDQPAAPTPDEIWGWLSTKSLFAPCFIKDVLDMKESGVKGDSNVLRL
jgi:hypothetical protein